MTPSAPATHDALLVRIVVRASLLRSFAVMATAGDAPRSRRILRLIALERSARGVLLLAAGAYLITHLGSDFGRIADHAMRAVELDPRRPFLHRIISRLHRLHARTLLVTGIAAIGYGLLELVEGVGLWLDQLWAEYLTVIATSLLIPVEVYELVRKPTLLKAGGIAVNAAIVAYLAWMLRRRLVRHSPENPPSQSG
jgi:uncharacterized membrane protein (DUF2068 family)